ncbi:class I SAM-dependent methyltransferase [Paenibacillus sp. KN14-4R]|uniref:class I SAM-dependent methyltransferase n=1 Tax=Paenibacillus sp. KN14-4R TaxID=3445773 RepID=UPI003F9EE56D
MNQHIKENLKRSYDENAKLRDKSSIEPWKLNELDYFLSLLNLRKQTKILDLGAGSGQHSRYIKENGHDVTCIDISPKMVEACIRRGLNALKMDFYNLSFEDNFFDGIWAMNSLLHIPKQDLLNVLKEIRRVMKPESTFYMGVYGGYNSEGIWEEDPCQPQRFFSFYDEMKMKEKVTQIFDLQEFRTVPLEGMKLNFQGMVLRKG